GGPGGGTGQAGPLRRESAVTATVRGPNTTSGDVTAAVSTESESFGSRSRLPKARSFLVNELQMMIDVLHIIFHHRAHPHGAAAVVGTLAFKGVVGQHAQYAGELPAADFEEDQGIFQCLVMGKEAIDVGGFVGVKQGRIVFGKHALHAVD